jgi:hypothetical protein
MFPLPGLDQRDQNAKAIAFRGVALRNHQALDFLEDAAVIALSLDRLHVMILPSNCLRIDHIALAGEFIAPLATERADRAKLSVQVQRRGSVCKWRMTFGRRVSRYVR